MSVVFDKLLEEPLLHRHMKIVSSEPVSAAQLDQIYITTTHEIKMYYDGNWYLLHTLTVPDKILLESGDYLLLENGSKFLME